MRTSRFLAALGGVIAAASLSACSLSAPRVEPVAQEAPAAESTPEATAEPGEAAGAEAPATGSPQVLRIAQVTGLSSIVVNAKGRTIYRFDDDSNDPPTTNCVEKCNETWQPVLAPNGVEVDAGLEEDLVGTVERPDGAEQLTLNGWPMYYFHEDLSLGQIAGHGTGDKWWAISPAGGRAEKTSDEPAAAKKPQVLRAAGVDGLSPDIVVNAKGRTIYRFDKDDNNPPRTTCVGKCLETWQPVLAPTGWRSRTGSTRTSSARSPGRTAASSSRSRAGRSTTSTRTCASARSPGTARATCGLRSPPGVARRRRSRPPPADPTTTTAAVTRTSQKSRGYGTGRRPPPPAGTPCLRKAGPPRP
nr:hypothetical protein [Phytohabitans flavus]